jgi:fructokinase
MFYSFGEVLFDCFKDSKVLGGAAFNLAAHLSHLGSEVALISAVGQDAEGEEILKEIKQRGIKSQYVKVCEDLITGRVDVKVDAKGIPSYDILYPVAWDYIDFEISPQENSFLVFGTLALRSEMSRQSLITNLKNFSTRIFDVNLREPFYTPDLIIQFLDKVEVMKLNEDELDILCRFFQLEEEDMIRKLFSTENLEMVLITKGKEGATVILKDGRRYSQKPQMVEVVDTVGCGDSFLAGYLHYYYTKKVGPEEALDQAIKISTMVATQRGAMPNYIHI